MLILKAPNNDTCISPVPIEGWVEITQEELEAVRAGRVILPTAEQIARVVKDATDTLAAREDATIAVIAAMTPAQAAQYIENNVTNLAEAKAVLKIMAKALCVLARRI